MIEKSPIFVVHVDETVCRALESALGHYMANTGVYQVCRPEAVDAQVDPTRCLALGRAAMVLGGRAGVHVAEPIRIGAILDRVLRIERINGFSQGESALRFSGWVLDVTHNLLSREVAGQSEGLRLTEKEVAILKILHAADGQSVSREVLLDLVWGYADGVETHTLETHIYRLRQKIEDDPAGPSILLTGETGYQLIIGD